MKIIIAKNPKNDNLCVLYPSNVYADDRELMLLAEKTFSSDYDRRIIQESELPNENLFFDAIEYDNLQININKAKKIQLDRYRKARVRVLEKLDIEFMRAVETKNDLLQQEIAQKKQALRDITVINLPDTLEGIKNTWPDILN